jgi:hypothetical protein
MAAAGTGAYLAVRSQALPEAAPVMERRAEAPTAVQQASKSPAPAASSPAKVQPSSPARAARPASVSLNVQKPAPSAPVTPQPTGPAAPIEAENPSPAPVAPVTEAVSAPVVEAPPAPMVDERTVSAAAVIGIRLDTAVSSETAHVEDRVSARVTRDVKVDGQTAIPAGARLEGWVSLVERGGKLRDRARIGLRFSSLLIGDERIPIQTEAIYRDGDSPANEATAKIGASAVVGSILGAVIGGRKGAAVGGMAGAAGGTAAVMASGRNEASIAAGTPLTVRLTAPVTVLSPHEE